MAYDRYDTRNDPRGGRPRWRDERGDEGGWRGDRSHSGRDERGFFERAGDQIASWFGDEDDDRGRHEHRIRGERRGSAFGEDRGDYWRDRTWDRGDFEHDDDRFRPSGWGVREREYRRDRGYQPMTGDYGRGGRSEQFFAAGGIPRGGFGRGEDDRSGFERSQSPWGRDEYRRTSFAGSREGSRDFDPHYQSWRQRQVSELDRDYDEYRRENQSRFEDEFSNWRQKKTQKRGLLGQIREHMQVVGSDDEPVGTVDRVAGDRIILTKSDPESGGVHHSLGCTAIDRVEGDKVILDCKADQAKQRWRDENRDRALFEREDQGEEGPHMLNRSFEGTYR